MRRNVIGFILMCAGSALLAEYGIPFWTRVLIGMLFVIGSLFLGE